ncbi:MAG: hypothetical protein IID37_10990 [Planctomycetes bacterium]|nr:hypothetical protein [Planctomycetota bacterium]
MTSKSLKTASVAAVFSVLLFAAPPAVHAETCVTDPAEVSPVEVCLDWDDPEDPSPVTDFQVDFTTDPAQPNVELIAGNLDWQLWALDPADPEGIGDVGDITAFGAEDYGLIILQGAFEVRAPLVVSVRESDGRVNH